MDHDAARSAHPHVLSRTEPSDMMAVVADGLTKQFGGVAALQGVDLEVTEGSVLSLLGPNGAGKTTTVRILATLISADAGRASVAGYDVATEARSVRELIGLTGQYAAIDERLTGRENLEHVGRLWSLGRGGAHRRAGELLERFGLTGVEARVAGSLSGGLRRRLDLAMSLVGSPRVLFLDEPTTGLDPRSRHDLWELVAGLALAGTTIVLTTQYLDEADTLADQVAVIDHGRVIASGTPADLKRQVGADQVIVLVGARDQLPATADALVGQGVGPPTVDEARCSVSIPVDTLAGAVPAAVRAVDAAGVEVIDVVTHHATLDDVFFALTGRPAAPAGAEAATP